MPLAVVKFPEWKPDLFRESPALAICDGFRPRLDFYEAQPKPGNAASYALAAACTGAANMPSAGSNVVLFYDVAGTGSALYYDTGATWASIATGFTDADIWRFADTNLYNGSTPYWLAAPSHMSGGQPSTGADPIQIVSSTTAVAGPIGAVCVAGVGQFAVAGHCDVGTPVYAAYIRWSDIGNPTSWSTPGSGAAIAAQAGEQFFPAQYGPVTYISPISDRSGYVFQENAIHLMTYVGGDIVWQFDTIAVGVGNAYVHGAIRIGSAIYFVSLRGFHKIEGNAITEIGEGKINRYWINQLNTNATNYRILVQVAYHEKNHNIYWGFPGPSATTQSDEFMVYNIIANRWSTISASLAGASAREFLYSSRDSSISGLVEPKVIDTAHKQRSFDNGTAFTGVIATGEENLNPGGRAILLSCRLIGLETSSDNTITPYTRDTFSSEPAAATAFTVNTRGDYYTGRAEARFHTVRITRVNVPTSKKIVGVELEYEATGML